MTQTQDSNLKRGTLEMILLKLISERAMYGYELATTLERRAGPGFELKEGTLYPVLYRLENEGLVETRWETLERGVPRKYYTLTEKGAAHLERLVEEWQAFTTSVERILAGPQ
jgi:PadR family transcriptional regulator PadR